MLDAIILSSWNFETWNVTERLALGLSRYGGKVLYVDSPRSIFRVPRSDRRFFIEHIETQLFRLRPLMISTRLNNLSWVEYMSSKMVFASIRQAINELQLHNPIIFYHAWQFTNVLRWLNGPKAHICMDWSLPAARPLETKLMDLADVILVIPETAYHRHKARYPAKTYQILTSCDYQILEQIRQTKTPCPPELASIPCPRLGYVGSLVNGYVNIELLIGLARAKPQWQFVMIGPVKDDQAKGHLNEFANIHLLGRRPREYIANYVKFFDVGLLLYDLSNEHPQHGVPLKLFEYFAMGLPVVSTPLVELYRYMGLVWTADTSEQFIPAIEEALDEPVDSPKKQERIDVARSHDIPYMIESVTDALRRHGVIAG